MDRVTTDIVVAGGGIAGLTATAALAARGFDVVCVEPTAPAAAPTDDNADLRSTAFLDPSIDLLKEAGLWDRLAAHATDLVTMRLCDAGGTANEIRETADFSAPELGRARFGCNLPNWLLRQEMSAALDRMPNVTLMSGARVTNMLARTAHVILRLSNGRTIQAALAVAADGRDSFLRHAAGIGVSTWRYGQKALAFAVSHPLPHTNISTEIHRTGGPFTLVPLPDRNGVPHSAVVWMATGPDACDLHQLDQKAFETALNTRACNVLGPLRLASPRALWPIVSQRARHLCGPRLALIAEAAHVVPPIGAQGLNMSLADIATLRDLVSAARDSGQDIGAPPVLTRYHRTRYPDIVARVSAIDALNRAALAQTPALRDIRRQGLAFLARTPPLRQTAMRAGLGLSPAR